MTDNVIPIDRPRVVPGGIDERPVTSAVICGVVVAVLTVPWWVGAVTIARWILR